ncbi:response regulator [Rhodobacteraceae bacterium]|nr:response regulator [Paracoccaceae bacterium]
MPDRRYSDADTHAFYPVVQLRPLAMLTASLVVVLSLVVLGVGYGLSVMPVVRVYPQWAAMVPQTAVALLALGGAQLLALLARAHTDDGVIHAEGSGSGSGGGRAGWRSLRGLGAKILCLVLLVIAVSDAIWSFLETYESLFGPDVALDPRSDRMAIGTAIGVAMAACVIGLQLCAHRKARPVMQVIATTGLLMAMVGLDGYLFDAPALYETALLSAMAFHTCLGLALLFLAALLGNPRGSWMGDLASSGPGGRMARRLFLFAVAGPILLSYLALKSTQLGYLSPNLRLSSLAILLALLAALVTLRVARFHDHASARAVAEQKRLAEVLEGLDTAVFVMDMRNSVHLTNRAAEAISGGDPEAFLFHSAFHAIDDRRALRDKEHPVAALLALSDKGTRPPERRCGWIDRYGAEHALRLTLSFVTPSAGQSKMLRVISVHDETEGWILRENLSRVERLDAIGQMSGGVAHEMSNILGVVQIAADTLTHRAAQGPLGIDHRDQLEAIRAACARGANLTTHLLRLTRDTPDEISRFDIVARLRNVAELARRMLPAMIALKVDLVKGPWVVRCAPQDLETAVLNLVINARNAIVETGHGRTITLSLHIQDDGDLCLEVADDGPGMTPALLAHVRTPFYTTRHAQGGTGLGLAMIDSFVRKIDGRFTLDAQEGQGTRARIILPIQPKHGTLATQYPEDETLDEAMVARLRGVRIMIVEDDPQFRDLIARALSALEMVVFTAPDGTAALADLGAMPVPPDLLVTDLMLSGPIDGFETAARARAMLPDLGLLYLTGYVDPLLSRDDKPKGVILRKPVTLSALLNAIRLSLP